MQHQEKLLLHHMKIFIFVNYTFVNNATQFRIDLHYVLFK